MTRCAVALSTHPVAAHATGDIVADIMADADHPPDLLLVVVTAAFAGAVEDIHAAVATLLAPEELVIVSSSGLLGAGTEVDGRAAIGTLALWSDAGVPKPRVLALDDGLDALDDRMSQRLLDSSLAIVVGSHASSLTGPAIDELCRRRGERITVGGLLTSALGPPKIRTGSVGSSELVAVLLEDQAEVRLEHGVTLLGPPSVVTEASGSLLVSLDGRPALDAVQGVLRDLDPGGRPAAEDLVLVLVDPHSATILDTFTILGADRTSRAIALTVAAPIGATVALGSLTGPDDTHPDSRTAAGPVAGALVFAGRAVERRATSDGVAEIGAFSDTLGTTTFLGLHVSAVVGPRPTGSGLSPVPLTAVILGRGHH